MENQKNFHQDDLLQLAIDAVRRAPTPDTLPPERIDQLVATIEQAADQPNPFTMTERTRRMKSRFVLKIAVVAIIVVASFGLMSWLAPNGITSLAFADVAEAINRVKTATWKTTTVSKQLPQGKLQTSTTIGMFMAPAHERMESITEGITSIVVSDGKKNKIMGFYPKDKKAGTMSYKGPFQEGTFGNTFLNLQTMVTDAKDDKNKTVERLGTETIDGRRTEVFCFRKDETIAQGNSIMKYKTETKIWADTKTSLPIRVELFVLIDGDYDYKNETHSVMTDFQMDVKLDPSLFSTDVPEGYEVVQKTQLDFSKGPLPMVAEMLGMVAEINGGVFPDSLHGQDGLDDIMEFIPEILAEKYPNDQQKVMDCFTKLSVAVTILTTMTRQDTWDWHYAGKGAKLHTPNRPIFWCKIERDLEGRKLKEHYEVIYADLSVKVVPKEDLPKVPEAEGGPEAEKPKDANK